MKTKEELAAYNKSYYEKNKERLLPIMKERVKIWQVENKERRNQNDRERRQRGDHPNKYATQRHRKKLKEECITAYGGKCSCCNESHINMLTIDHINNNGSEHRKTYTPGGGSTYRLLKKLGFPRDEYQCLCFNCNYSKYANKGTCSHKL